ncbi:twin-arginine translocation pathway signal [Rhodobacteraceae bacterium KLH11]|nr:twin-arginine translocation pathway signal [Rhodobacteraceae bacterium KLH11]
MTNRRTFLAGLAAASLAPVPGWASVGAPDFLAAALFPDGSYRLAGLDATGAILFSVPLPARGHAAAAHPHKAQAIAFARRPGTFALVIDCATGAVLKHLQAPAGRHFYGHGTFSADGTRFFTTENDYEAAEGVIGVWDAASYARVSEFSSGGIGPHDIRLMPGGDMLVIANGGIETHPDSGRVKLNLPTMRPNLTYADLSGSVVAQVELRDALHKNSIRHLAVRGDGLVGFAMQWQGDQTEHPPLLGLHRLGQKARLFAAPAAAQNSVQGYAGSIAFSADGNAIAITCPRGNTLHRFSAHSGTFKDALALEDVCGLGAGTEGLIFTTGTGAFGVLTDTRAAITARPDCQWDNHLIPIHCAV